MGVPDALVPNGAYAAIIMRKASLFMSGVLQRNYRQVSNISRTSLGNKIVDHSDVIGASPVGAAPTTYSFST